MQLGVGCARSLGLVVLALAGCGGGGSDSAQLPGPVEPQPVVPTAFDLDQAVLLAGRVGNLWGLAQTVSAFSERLVENYTLGGSYESRGDCALSGSITNSYRDMDGNWKLSAGDSLGMVGNACQELDDSRLAVTTTGSVFATVKQVEGIIFYGSDDRWLMSSRQTYQDLAMKYPSYGFRWNGSVEVRDNSVRSVVKFDDLIQQSVTTQTSVIHAISGELTREYGSYRDRTIKALLLKELALRTNLNGTTEATATIPGESRIEMDPTGTVPASGEIKVKVGNGAVNIAVIGVDQVRVELDLQGDGSIEASRTLSWTALVGNAVL